ncbi:MAG TPA: hypothetical protein PK858_10745, partial [Saprospiraceae bacterium]|nr:hypothetical protein [Saprospiraceae bacterium]
SRSQNLTELFGQNTKSMPKISSIGFKRLILFCTALLFFAVAAGYVCENRLAQNGISSLSLDQENLYTL